MTEKMTLKEQRNFQQLPAVVRGKLLSNDLNELQQQKRRTVASYSSHVKLKAVVRWKERMVKAGLTTTKIAAMIDVPNPRVSEWVNYTWEPSEEVFHKIEKILYKNGA